MERDILVLHQLLQEGYCCSQAMVELGLRLQGREDSLLVQSASALCLGVRGGLTCGALTGAAMALSLYDSSLAVSEMIPELTEWFRDYSEQRFGGSDCDDILAGDPANRALRCPGVLDAVWEKCREILEDQGFEIEFPED